MFVTLIGGVCVCVCLKSNVREGDTLAKKKKKETENCFPIFKTRFGHLSP